MTYEANGWIKFVEEDSFEHGCLSKTSFMVHGNERFSGATLDDLLKALNEFTGNNDAEAIEFDACDEQGRVDIQIMETAEGYAADKSDIAVWREGKRRLWLVCYSFRVEHVERKPVALAA